MKMETTINYNCQITDKFFIDSNVWLYLYYPQSSNVSDKIINEYSEIFAQIKRKQLLISSNMIQFSEIINTIINIEFRLYKEKTKKFSISLKEFKKQDEFKETLQNAKTITERILTNVHLRDGIFNESELKNIVLQSDKADFNDIYFVHFCKKEKLHLISHDFDFNALDNTVKLISANKKFGKQLK